MGKKTPANYKVEQLEREMAELKKGVEKALDTMTNGFAKNIQQLWDNQRELAAALSEMNENLVVTIEEMRNEEGTSTRSPLPPKVG